MDIDPTSGANALGGQSVEPPATDLDRSAFMRLLVTQIQNQDPMDPMDTRDMMAQLAQLTSVEYLIGIEQGIGTLQIGTASIANAQVAGFVGQTVTADASRLRVEETGEVAGAFQLDGRASRVTATIRDEAGRTVRTVELGEYFAGDHRYTWDGMNDDGTRVDPGRYTVEIEAVGENGAPVASRTRVRGVVTGVSYENGYPELILDGEHKVLMGDVREISDPGGSRSTPTPGSTSGSTSGTTNESSEATAQQPLNTIINPEAVLASYGGTPSQTE